jgi:threonyl-tRNA synthetase
MPRANLPYLTSSAMGPPSMSDENDSGLHPEVYRLRERVVALETMMSTLKSIAADIAQIKSDAEKRTALAEAAKNHENALDRLRENYEKRAEERHRRLMWAIGLFLPSVIAFILWVFESRVVEILTKRVVELQP